MVIAVLGQTDKRPVIYCLMKLLQKLGDCAIVTKERHYARLIDNGTNVGHFQNIFIAVTDANTDEIFSEIGYRVEDFENIIIDCLDQIPEYADVTIYVGGAGGKTEDEEILLETCGEYFTINLGFGDKNIPYKVEMFKCIEEVEGLKHLGPMDPQIASRIGTILTDRIHMPVKNIVKVVCAK